MYTSERPVPARSSVRMSEYCSPAMSATAATMLPTAFTPPERKARARGRIAAETWLYTSSVAGRCSAGIQMRSPSCRAMPARSASVNVPLTWTTVAAAHPYVATYQSGGIAIDRFVAGRAESLGPVLVLHLAAAALRQPAVQHECDEAHEEPDRLRADEVLGVHDRGDPRADDAAEDLADEHRPGKEGEEPLRLLGVVEVAGVDPEEDVDRLLHAVREYVRDRLDDLPNDLGGDRVLQRDREDRHRRDVDEQHGAPAHAVDEEEDERGDREHRDRRDDVHPGHVRDAIALDEQGVRAEFADPVGADHERQQDVEEEPQAPLPAMGRARR